MSATHHLEDRPDAHQDVESSLEAAEYALYLEGDLHSARWWFDFAYQEAEACGDVPTMARAALGLGGVWVHEHRTAAEAEKVRMRQLQALRAVDDRSSLAVRLRARLGAEADYAAGKTASILESLAEARAAGDSVAVAEALSLAHHCLMDPGHQEFRLELAHELIGQAAQTGRRGDLLIGLLWRTVDLLLAADAHAERSLTELRVLLSEKDHLAVGFAVKAIEVMLTIRAGRLVEAEALAATCKQHGHVVGDADAVGWYGAHLATIRWYQGRIGELVPMLSALLNSPTLGYRDYVYFPALAMAAATAGDQRLARGMLARLGDLADLPRAKSWLVTLHGVAEAAAVLEDASLAAQVHDLLSPHAHRPVIAGVGVACFGSAHHALGMTSITMGETDRAVDHLRQAVRSNLALGHWPAAALSRWRLGQVLAMRHGSDDEDARRQLALAEEEAAALGMALPAPVPGPSAPTPSGTVRAGRGGTAVRCIRHGRGWKLTWAGRTALVHDSVGMRHLAVLIANPGWQIPAVELAGGLVLGAETSAYPSGSGQPVLDEQAQREYKNRLAQIQAEIEEYESLQDLERAAAARAERDWLLAELAAATGLNRRARAFPDSNERARIAVGKAIRRALVRIAEADPVIADELRETVQTGGRCCYHLR